MLEHIISVSPSQSLITYAVHSKWLKLDLYQGPWKKLSHSPVVHCEAIVKYLLF